MAWNVKGQLVESCSCNMFCPCWFGVQDLMIMDQGWCSGLLGIRIREGSADGLSLDGRTVMIGIDFPGPTLFDADATARVFIDDGADADQQRELEPIMQGSKGGPMENIAPLVSTWLPTRTAQIEVDDAGDSITITASGTGALRSQLLRDPAGTAFTLRGGGFVAGLGMEVADLAPTSSEWADADMPKRFETKSGARGEIDWSG
jgi:hypothetical protein